MEKLLKTDGHIYKLDRCKYGEVRCFEVTYVQQLMELNARTIIRATVIAGDETSNSILLPHTEESKNNADGQSGIMGNMVITPCWE